MEVQIWIIYNSKGLKLLFNHLVKGAPIYIYILMGSVLLLELGVSNGMDSNSSIYRDSFYLNIVRRFYSINSLKFLVNLKDKNSIENNTELLKVCQVIFLVCS